MSYILSNFVIIANILTILTNFDIFLNIKGHLRPVPPVSEGEVDARFKSNL